LEFLKHTLSNGLEIVAECNDQAYSTALGFFVRAGSRDEGDENSGVSHFLEHMIFKGTPTRTADDVNREFDEMGASYNAFTSEEHTVYYAAVLPEYQDRATQLLADILRPSLREEDFEMEKQVILEEIRMYEDQPPFGADEKCRALYFAEHPLSRSVLGTVESITELSVDAMRGYFAGRYSPENVVLAATGRVDFDRLVAAVGQLCGQWNRGNGRRELATATPAAGFHVVHKEIATQEYVVQFARGPGSDDDDRFAAKLLATVIGDDTGSRIYWELIDTGVAEQASLGHYEYDDTGVFLTYLSCAPELAAENLQRLHDLLSDVGRQGVTAEELAQAKNKVCSRIVLSSERPQGRLFVVGGDWIQRREYRSVRDDLDAISGITMEQIAQVISRYPLTESTIMTIGPLTEVARPL
jgi:predicted Zn-dependent peptidase